MSAKSHAPFCVILVFDITWEHGNTDQHWSRFGLLFNYNQQTILERERDPDGDSTNALGENSQSSLQNMFTLYAFNSTIAPHFPSKFAHMYLCGMHYQWLWQHYCKGNSFGDIGAIMCDDACRGPYCTSGWPTACMNHKFIVDIQAWSSVLSYQSVAHWLKPSKTP